MKRDDGWASALYYVSKLIIKIFPTNIFLYARWLISTPSSRMYLLGEQKVCNHLFLANVVRDQCMVLGADHLLVLVFQLMIRDVTLSPNFSTCTVSLIRNTKGLDQTAQLFLIEK